MKKIWNTLEIKKIVNHQENKEDKKLLLNLSNKQFNVEVIKNDDYYVYYVY